jgi:hypothetical protein
VLPDLPASPLAPSAPVDPVAPVYPVAPVFPVSPVAPVYPVFPVAPVAPVSPFVTSPVAPVAPCGPAGPGTVTTVGAGVITVGLSHALNPSAAISDENSIEYLMMVSLIWLIRTGPLVEFFHIEIVWRGTIHGERYANSRTGSVRHRTQHSSSSIPHI